MGWVFRRVCACGQGVKAAQDGFDVARAGMVGGVQQPVAGHLSVLAGTTHEVISSLNARGQVIKLGPPLAEHEVLLRRLVAVTPPMRSGVLDGRHSWRAAFHLPRSQVKPDSEAGLVGPDECQVVRHEDVCRRAEVLNRGYAPQSFARSGVIRNGLPVARVRGVWVEVPLHRSALPVLVLRGPADLTIRTDHDVRAGNERGRR